MEIAPMALYNALRYNYSDADGCSLLVDIGSRTTNLLFCEPGKIFPRRLNIGGSTVTTAIGKDLNVAYPDADARKAEDGFVSLGGTYAEPDDEEVARISKIIRNQMTRLHQEIARSITFYRSEHGGTAPQRVLLAGGTASLPYMREFFQEKFPGLEVEYFNPLRNVSVASSLDVEAVGRDAHTLGEVIGLGLRAVGSCPMELNLRPVSVVKAERIASQRPFMIAAGVLVLAGLAALWQYNSRAADETRKATEEIEAKSAPLKALDGRIGGTIRAISAVEESTKPLIKSVNERDYWARVIAELNQRLPQDYIWITSFEPPSKDDLIKAEEAANKPAAGARPPAGRNAAKKAEEPEVIVMVSGLYLSSDAGNLGGPASTVDQFIKNLKESQLLEPIDDPTRGYTRGTDNTPDWAFKFTLPVKLKNPIDLK